MIRVDNKQLTREDVPSAARNFDLIEKNVRKFFTTHFVVLFLNLLGGKTVQSRDVHHTCNLNCVLTCVLVFFCSWKS